MAASRVLYGSRRKNLSAFLKGPIPSHDITSKPLMIVFPVVSQPCICVCRLQRLVAQAVLVLHLVTCRVHNVNEVFRQPKGCATMRPCTVATTPIGARSVGWAASPPPTLDATWQSTPAYATSSVMSVLRSFAVLGA